MTNVQRPFPSDAPPPDERSVWTLTDGAAGNVRQAEALAAALGVVPARWALRTHAPWRWVAPRRWPGASRAFGHAFHAGLARPPQLAIGCGRQAALATRLLHDRGARAVQILDPRVDARAWDLLVVPCHDERRGENVILVMGSLHPVDAAWLAQARQEFPWLGESPGPRTTVLVGGTTHGARFDMAALDHWLSEVAAQVRAEGGSVLATTSRRTPAEAVTAVQARLSGLPGVVWTGGGGPNPYPGLLGWADRIVCSADSVNMLSEAAATDVPLFVAGPARGRPARFVEQLLASGRARRMASSLDGYPVTPLLETPRVAAEIRQRLQWPPAG